jgi:hypothetical protein
MACSCKSNSSVKKQVTQLKNVSNNSSSQVVRKTNNQERKQIIIRRPIR